MVVEGENVLDPLSVVEPGLDGPWTANDKCHVGVCKSRSTRKRPRCSQSSCRLVVLVSVVMLMASTRSQLPMQECRFDVDHQAAPDAELT